MDAGSPRLGRHKRSGWYFDVALKTRLVDRALSGDYMMFVGE